METLHDSLKRACETAVECDCVVENKLWKKIKLCYVLNGNCVRHVNVCPGTALPHESLVGHQSGTPVELFGSTNRLCGTSMLLRNSVRTMPRWQEIWSGTDRPKTSAMDSGFVDIPTQMKTVF